MKNLNLKEAAAFAKARLMESANLSERELDKLLARYPHPSQWGTSAELVMALREAEYELSESTEEQQ